MLEYFRGITEEIVLVFDFSPNGPLYASTVNE